jgi:molybdate transport system ATP-binding protein
VSAEITRRSHVVDGTATAAFSLRVDTRFGRGITCVLGPSGAGKSTLLGVIAGLVTPDRGRVALDDDVWLDRARGVDVPVHRRRVAYLFQQLALFPHLDARDNVAYPLAASGLARPERHQRAEALLARLGVAHLARRRPRTYSGGEAQRVAMARALAMTPRVMLLDEPFSALDRELKIPLMSLVRDLADETGVPVVAVTHSIGETRALADRVVRIAGGQIVADGAPEDVLGRDGRGEGGGRGLEHTPPPVLIRS